MTLFYKQIRFCHVKKFICLRLCFWKIKHLSFLFDCFGIKIKKYVMNVLMIKDTIGILFFAILIQIQLKWSDANYFCSLRSSDVTMTSSEKLWKNFWNFDLCSLQPLRPIFFVKIIFLRMSSFREWVTWPFRIIFLQNGHLTTLKRKLTVNLTMVIEFYSRA